MTDINLDKVSQIAFLKLTDEEKQSIEKSLLNDINNAQDMLHLNVENIQPTYQITIGANLRADVIVPSTSRDELLKNSTDPANGGFCVPKIVE